METTRIRKASAPAIYGPTRMRDSGGRVLAAAMLAAAFMALAGCASDESEPVSTGSGVDKLPASPCACNEVPQKNLGPGDLERIKRRLIEAFG